MVILLKGKKCSIKNAINTEYISSFKVLGNVNLTTKINSNSLTILINFQNYVNMASSFWRPWEYQE